MVRLMGCMMATLLSLAALGGYSGRIALDKADGIYKVGETATCRVTLLKDQKPLRGVKARLLLRFEGKTVESRDFETTGRPMEFTFSAERPGWAYFGFEVLDDSGKPLRGKGVYKHRMKPTIVTEIGAMFDPEKIRTGVKCPDDFDAFWSSRREALNQVPLEARLTELNSGDKDIKLFGVEIQSLGAHPATGYLAYPAGAAPKSLPGYIEFLSWSSVDANRRAAINTAKRGALAFAASWHGFPVNKGREFYAKEVPKFIRRGMPGIEDRDKWIFSDMYYRVMRALDYIKSRPEWDGKTLVVMGGSLGGAQAAAAAALDDDVTLAVVSVPCFCEFDGPAAGRVRSIPHRNDRLTRSGDRRPLEAGAYYDLVNLAPRIKCETFVCTGFTDELCPPSNVYAFYNALPDSTPKVMSTNPRTGHYGTTSNVRGNARLEQLFRSIVVQNYTE